MKERKRMDILALIAIIFSFVVLSFFGLKEALGVVVSMNDFFVFK